MMDSTVSTWDLDGIHSLQGQRSVTHHKVTNFLLWCLIWFLLEKLNNKRVVQHVQDRTITLTSGWKIKGNIFTYIWKPPMLLWDIQENGPRWKQSPAFLSLWVSPWKLHSFGCGWCPSVSNALHLCQKKILHCLDSWKPILLSVVGIVLSVSSVLLLLSRRLFSKRVSHSANWLRAVTSPFLLPPSPLCSVQLLL